MKMSWEETEDFLKKSHTLRFATTKANGRPHVTPLAYLYHNGRVYSCTASNRAKIENIRSNPYVAVLVDREENPQIGVLVEGKARIMQDSEEGKRIASIFQSERGWSLDTVIEVTPEKITAWKERYATGASKFHLNK